MTSAAVAEAPTDADTEWQDMPCRPESAALARRTVRARLNAWGLGQLSENAELLVTELVSNAARHAGCQTIRLYTTFDGVVVRVAVRDSSRTMPVRIHTDRDAESGRGLHLVHRLSHRWGAEPQPLGKVVWFELRRPRSKKPAGP